MDVRGGGQPAGPIRPAQHGVKGIQFDLTGPNGFTGFSGAVTSSGLIDLPTSGTYTLTVHTTQPTEGAYAFEMEETSLTALASGVPLQRRVRRHRPASALHHRRVRRSRQLLINLQGQQSRRPHRAVRASSGRRRPGITTSTSPRSRRRHPRTWSSPRPRREPGTSWSTPRTWPRRLPAIRSAPPFRRLTLTGADTLTTWATAPTRS